MPDSVISLLWLHPSSMGLAFGIDSYYDIDPNEIEEAEYEILLMELEALGLTFDSPEVQGMDNGDIWRYIEEKKKQQATTGEDQP